MTDSYTGSPNWERNNAPTPTPKPAETLESIKEKLTLELYQLIYWQTPGPDDATDLAEIRSAVNTVLESYAQRERERRKELGNLVKEMPCDSGIVGEHNEFCFKHRLAALLDNWG